MTQPLTSGVHHIGLAVSDLEASVRFFVEALDWFEKGRNVEYPAAFVSDGIITITLWRVAEPDKSVPFDRRKNIGLHHLALATSDLQALLGIYNRLRAHPGVIIEFAPQPTKPGSSRQHFMCLMPGGIRIEFATNISV